MKDLTNTAVTRQNILNNPFAVAEIQQAVGIKGVLFENEYKFLKRQIADFYEVTERTIDNCLMKNKEELTKNGYEVLSGNRLIDFMLVSSLDFDREIDFSIKFTVLGIFNFRSFLNSGMLLSYSNKACVGGNPFRTCHSRVGGNPLLTTFNPLIPNHYV